jgi:hypothetical protein
VTDATVQALIDDPAIESVEIKLTVRDDQERIVEAALERADVDPEEREIYYFDNDALDLYAAGLVLRARKVKDDTDDTTVKLRPVVPSEIDDDWKRLAEFNIEMDAVGEKMVCSAKLDAEQGRGEIDSVAAGDREIHKLFTTDQEKLLREYAPKDIDWDDLRPLGPIEARKWELEPEGFDHELTVEIWVLPDGTDLVELSIKVSPDQAEEASAAMRDFLAARGLDVEGDQQTKTRAALSFFTGHGI